MELHALVTKLPLYFSPGKVNDFHQQIVTYPFLLSFFFQISMNVFLNGYLINIVTSPTTVTLMPAVQTQMDHIIAPVIWDTLEMESRASVMISKFSFT